MTSVIICQWCGARCYREESYMIHECVTPNDFPSIADYSDYDDTVSPDYEED